MRTHIFAIVVIAFSLLCLVARGGETPPHHNRRDSSPSRLSSWADDIPGPSNSTSRTNRNTYPSQGGSSSGRVGGNSRGNIDHDEDKGKKDNKGKRRMTEEEAQEYEREAQRQPEPDSDREDAIARRIAEQFGTNVNEQEVALMMNALRASRRNQEIADAERDVHQAKLRLREAESRLAKLKATGDGQSTSRASSSRQTQEQNASHRSVREPNPRSENASTRPRVTYRSPDWGYGGGEQVEIDHRQKRHNSPVRTEGPAFKKQRSEPYRSSTRSSERPPQRERRDIPSGRTEPRRGEASRKEPSAKDKPAGISLPEVPLGAVPRPRVDERTMDPYTFDNQPEVGVTFNDFVEYLAGTLPPTVADVHAEVLGQSEQVYTGFMNLPKGEKQAQTATNSKESKQSKRPTMDFSDDDYSDEPSTDEERRIKKHENKRARKEASASTKPSSTKAVEVDPAIPQRRPNPCRYFGDGDGAEVVRERQNAAMDRYVAHLHHLARLEWERQRAEWPHEGYPTMIDSTGCVVRDNEGFGILSPGFWVVRDGAVVVGHDTIEAQRTFALDGSRPPFVAPDNNWPRRGFPDTAREVGRAFNNVLYANMRRRGDLLALLVEFHRLAMVCTPEHRDLPMWITIREFENRPELLEEGRSLPTRWSPPHELRIDIRSVGILPRHPTFQEFLTFVSLTGFPTAERETLGVIFDLGQRIYLPSALGAYVILRTAPSDHNARRNYQRHFMTLAASPGSLDDFVNTWNGKLENQPPTRQLGPARPTVAMVAMEDYNVEMDLYEVVRHLLACGITQTVMNDLYAYGSQSLYMLGERNNARGDTLSDTINLRVQSLLNHDGGLSIPLPRLEWDRWWQPDGRDYIRVQGNMMAERTDVLRGTMGQRARVDRLTTDTRLRLPSHVVWWRIGASPFRGRTTKTPTNTRVPILEVLFMPGSGVLPPESTSSLVDEDTTMGEASTSAVDHAHASSMQEREETSRMDDGDSNAGAPDATEAHHMSIDETPASDDLGVPPP